MSDLVESIMEVNGEYMYVLDEASTRLGTLGFARKVRTASRKIDLFVSYQLTPSFNLRHSSLRNARTLARI